MGKQLIAAEYRELLPSLKRLEFAAVSRIRWLAESYGERVRFVSSRVKSASSCFDSAEKNGHPETIDGLTDLVGLRVVCLFRSDLVPLRDEIENWFEIVREKNLAEGTVSTFGYESVHLVVRLRPSDSIPEGSFLANHPFEIQLRTLAMDTWATISHELAYKKKWAVSGRSEKDLHAVAALLYLADQQFDALYDTTMERHAAAVPEFGPEGWPKGTRVDPESLEGYLRHKFPDREVSSSDRLSELAESLVAAGITELDELDETVEAGLPSALAAEEDRRRRTASSGAAGRPAHARWLASDALINASDDFREQVEAEGRSRDAEMRADVVGRMPIPATVFLDLVEHVGRALETEGCTGLRFTDEFLASRPNIDAEATRLWLAEAGGYCDCEIMMNVMRYVVDEDAPED
ncbi:MAG: DUF2695 domain-containing protein [Coriobacteriia bacterium]